MVTVSIGFRAKTGRAIAVVLRGPIESPAVLSRHELILSDPKMPETQEPYHAVIDLPWETAAVAVREARAAIQTTASKAVEQLVRDARGSGFELCGVGIVCGSNQDPAKIGNPHIRAHAAEGRLFREVLEAGAEANGLFRRLFVEDEVYEKAASELRSSETALRERVAELGCTVGRPWRTDEKAATLAAWMVLAQLTIDN